ncbi:translocation and assembly module lipoprotein TamL [Chitinophagaceae bacterium MMS25-I14]
MNCSKTFTGFYAPVLFLLLMAALWSSCDSTRHLKKEQYLLRRNTLKLHTSMPVTRRGELADQLNALIIQKPNTYTFGVFPYKLWLYNTRYEKYQKDSTNFQIKSRTVEKPAIFDSLLERRSSMNMKSFLFNQGYFYARVTDTVVKKDQKAYVTYKVETGNNYLINKVFLDIDNGAVAKIVSDAMNETLLKTGLEYSNPLVDEERSRITDVLRNKGYYKFSQENIGFELDTVNKSYFKNAENPFESAINFIALQKQQKKPTLDIKLTIRAEDDSTVYQPYYISKVNVFPDVADWSDTRDSNLRVLESNDITFHYHEYFVHDRVIAHHIYLNKGDLYSQEKYNQTISKLNDLGIFQTVRVSLREDTSVHDRRALRVTILMNPTKRYNVFTNFEVSNGSTYSLGSAVSVGLRDNNLAKGANLFSTTVSAGVESAYYPQNGNTLLEHFYLLSKNVGINSSVDFPKFLVPFTSWANSKTNLPRTIIGAGYNLLDRVDYFTLTSTSANLTYNWKESQTKTWNITPAFVNIQRLPRIADSFQQRLNQNDFLRNTYKENFIEGESINYIYNDQGTRRAKYGYNYMSLGFEEAGTLLSAVDFFTPLRNYAQYLKFDFDFRRYQNVRKAQLAVRFYGGIGIPYDKSVTLPYVKQYFVGGAYSIRGWRVRNLGPGATLPNDTSINFIDRTGDIKLEANAEYRFPIVQLFSGAIKLNGAVFTDAGNIWLAKKSTEYPEGNLEWSTFGRDIAVSSGAGARLDIGGFFIIRFDLAFPIKKPYESDNGGWVLKEIAPYDKNWRNDNLILNIAIGYPF